MSPPNTEPRVCVSGFCQSLLSQACPVALAGPENGYLKQLGEPILLGMYSEIPATNPETSRPTLNYRLALDEIMTASLGGLFGPPRRPLVAVLCHNDPADVTASMAHLLDTLRVPAILSALQPKDLAAAYDAAATRGRPVFFLSPFDANSVLIDADEGGRLWHLLGAWSDLATAYPPLLARAEAYFRNIKGLTGPLRVGVVQAAWQPMVDLATAVEPLLEINGASVRSPTNIDNYFRVVTDSQQEVPQPDVTDAVARLLRDRPHVVISFGSAEFVQSVMPALENGLPVAERPFYILSPHQPFVGGLVQTVQSLQTTYLKDRISGVNFAGAVDTRLYQTYLTELEARFGEGLESTENYYDAVYFLVYAVAAALAGQADIDGDDIVLGMKSLVQPAAPQSFDVGQAHVPSALALLKAGGSFGLQGTLGPPDFNLVTGARKSLGSVWCLDFNQAIPTIKFDVLRLDAETQTTLSGNYVCSRFF